MSETYSAGIATAYGSAKRAGYTGSYADFCAAMAAITAPSATASGLPAGSDPTAAYNDGVFAFGIPKGDKGDTGATGPQGPEGATGATGNGIASIAKTATVGKTDTYTITYTDGTTTTFDVTNGEVTEAQMEAELAKKADKVGSAPDLIAGLAEGLNTDEGTTIEEPYNLKVSGGNGREKLKKIVGVSVGWKQAIGSLGTNGNANRATKSYNSTTQVATITPTDYTSAAVGLFFSGYGIVVGHKYFESAVINPGKAAPSRMGSSDHLIAVGSLTANTDNNVAVVYEATNTVACVFVDVTSWTNETYDLSKVMLCDLTLILGSTIADYVYSLETATAGAGVAWLKQHFSKMFGSYQPYDAGSIQSVTGLSEHVMRNADDEIIGTYPLDSTKTFRGVLKLDASNKPYADGDIYEADGTVTRRYGEKTYDGSEEWAASSVAQNVYYLALNTTTFPQLNDPSLQMVSNKYQYAGTGSNATFLDNYEKGVGAWVNTTVPTATQRYLYVKDSSISSVADFKASLAANPLTVVFTLQNEGTETAEPYTESQIVDGSGTEEFVSTSIVPVGNETFYLEDLKGKLEDLPTIPEAPTTNGTYVLKATVSGGVASYSWVSE